MFSPKNLARKGLHIVSWWHYMVWEILVNTGLGNGMLPDGTKPLPDSMLTYHQWGSVALIQDQFHRQHSI